MKKILFYFFAVISIMAKGQPSLYYADPMLGEVKDVLKSANGSVYIATDNGLFQSTPGTTGLTQINNLQCLSLYEMDTTIWLGTLGNIFRFDGNNWFSMGSTPGLPQGNYEVQQICATTDGLLYTLIDNFVYRYNGNNFVNFNRSGNSLAAIGNTMYMSTLDIQEVGFYNTGLGWQPLPIFPSSFFGAAHRSNQFIAKDSVLYNDAMGGIFSFENNQWDTVLLTSLSTKPRLAATKDDLFIKYQSKIVKINPITDTFSIDFMPFNDTYDLFKGYKNTLFVATTNRGNSVLEVFPNIAQRPHQYQTIAPNGFTTTHVASGESGVTDLDYEMTRINGIGALFFQNIWLSGNNQLLSAGSYRQNGADYYSGPIATRYDSTYLYRYNSVWKVTAAEIETHKQNYNKFSYTAPHGIATWPGNGDVSNGEAQFLAPFVDLNFNGIYEPRLGEYPEMRGTEMLYAIYNTQRGPNTASQTENDPIEIHSMIYGFDSAAIPASQQSLMHSYRIFNRGSVPYTDAKLGIFMDFDLGDPIDDLVGSDSIESLFYVYNSNLFDAGPIGFGNNPPAVVGTVLNHPLEGVSGFVNSFGPTGSPRNAGEVLNYLNSLWSDGSPIRLDNPSGPLDNNNGTGYNPSGSEPPTKWLFNASENWYHNPTFLGDYRLLPIVNMGNLNPGESFCLDMVMAYGRDTINPTNDVFASLNMAKANISSMQQLYNNLNYNCLGIAMNTETPIATTSAIALFPNPVRSGGQITVTGISALQQVNIISTLGQQIPVVFEEQGETVLLHIPRSLAAGVYVVHITTKAKTGYTQRIVIQ